MYGAVTSVLIDKWRPPTADAVWVCGWEFRDQLMTACQGVYAYTNVNVFFLLILNLRFENEIKIHNTYATKMYIVVVVCMLLIEW